jgi:hypothetical protein
MEPVDVFVDLDGLTRVGTELRAATGQFAEIGRPDAIRADSRDMGGVEIADAVAELGARWQQRYDELGRGLGDVAGQAELAVETYGITEADLAQRCTAGPTPAVAAGPSTGPRGKSGGW